MSEQHEYPKGWELADFDPNAHMQNLKGRDYLGVQHRLLWFLQEQRAFIKAGMAKMPYIVNTELVEMDRSTGFAHFKTTVRDVLGNEATAYGSEAAKDFPDYPEKAGTKSLGRALLMLGYGTAQAQEMDEGERVVDSPLERKQQPQAQHQRPQDYAYHVEDNSGAAKPETLNAIAKACELLGIAVPTEIKSEADAQKRLTLYRTEYRKQQAQAKVATTTAK